MPRKISAAPASANDSYTFSENSGVNATLSVRANDGKSSDRPLYSIDNGQLADLDFADPVSSAAATPDRSALGAAIWINSNGTIGYSTAPIAATVERLAPGQTLQDTFLYATLQQNGSLLWSTVRVTITGTNDAPIAQADIASVAEDAVRSGSVAGNDSDIDSGAVLSFAATSAAPGFTMAPNGTWSFNAGHAAYQDLAAGETRQVVVGYRVTDQYGAASNATLTITVTGTNDAPVASFATGIVQEDGHGSGRLTATDIDRGDVVRFQLVGSVPQGLNLSPDGNWAFDASGSAYQYLGASETRTLTVDYAASDLSGASHVSKLTITIHGANDSPVALASSGAVLEDGQSGGQLVATDADASARLTFSTMSALPEGLSIAADGSWTFDANHFDYQALAAGETRTIAVDYAVSDEHGASTSSTLTVVVTGTNDTPVTTSQFAEVTEGTPATGQLLALDQDNGAQLSFSVDGEAPAGFVLAADGSWSFDASGADYDALAEGAQQFVQIPFTVSDEHGASYSSFLLVLLTGTNESPSLTGSAAQLTDGVEDTVYLVTQAELLAGWSDPDGGSLTAVNLTVVGGSVVANEDGSFSITPPSNANGAVQLAYDVTDGLASSPASLYLTLAAVNDAAYGFSGALGGSVMEDVGSTVSGDAGFSDVDNSADTWTAITTPTASTNGYGRFTVSTWGVWQYQLDNSHPAVDALQAGQTLTDSFTIATLDGTTTQITITINGANEFVYVTPAVSTAADPNDFDTLHAELTRPSTLFNFYGTGASEVLEGSNGNDVMRAQGGADTVYGHNGNDSLHGELETSNQPPPLGAPGGDTLYGQAGNDTLAGGQGGDTLYGGSGTDTLHGNNSLGSNPETSGNALYGGSGNDRLYGDAGNDVLVGGTGADWLTGGAGADRFVFGNAADTGDWIFDFQRGSDVLDLAALGLDATGFVGQLSSAGMVGPGQVGFMTVMGGSQTDTLVYVDTDGVFGADLEIRLIGTSGLTANDIAWA